MKYMEKSKCCEYPYILDNNGEYRCGKCGTKLLKEVFDEWVEKHPELSNKPEEPIIVPNPQEECEYGCGRKSNEKGGKNGFFNCPSLTHKTEEDDSKEYEKTYTLEPTTPQTEEWEKEFDRRFNGEIVEYGDGGGNPMDGFDYPYSREIKEELKSFISNLLSSNTDRVKKEAFRAGYDCGVDIQCNYNHLWEEALEDYNNRLNNLK